MEHLFQRTLCFLLFITVDISWNCEEDEPREEERKELVYCVEVKKATEGEGVLKEIYRGKDKKCSVSGLEKNTEYNVCVKCVVGELQGVE